MASIKAGKAILDHVGGFSTVKYQKFADAALKTIEKEGWKEDHYVVTLTQTMNGLVNPWTGEKLSGPLEGWDAYHIYTANGLALLDMVGYDTGMNKKRLKEDFATGLENTLMKYGCRHTSYVNHKPPELSIPGLASIAGKVGWISMNMLRDIAAAYSGLDLFAMADRYWDWQVTVNTQDIFLFFETFYGNNLNFYPRGIAVFGYFEAAAGFRYDRIKDHLDLNPVRSSMDVPLPFLADWKTGAVPKMKTFMKGNRLHYTVE